jgi:hypothetical protein
MSSTLCRTTYFTHKIKEFVPQIKHPPAKMKTLTYQDNWQERKTIIFKVKARRERNDLEETALNPIDPSFAKPLF